MLMPAMCYSAGADQKAAKRLGWDPVAGAVGV